jgi:hypothetical protein
MHATAREFFESAREAARDAERIRRQLDAMESRALSLGGGGFEPRVRSTPDPDRIGASVSAMLDQGERLRERADEDYAIIDAACKVLYGADNRSGLYALVGWPADAIYHHYLALRTWEETASMLGYSVQHVRRQVLYALDLADANGQMWTELGRGMAT